MVILNSFLLFKTPQVLVHRFLKFEGFIITKILWKVIPNRLKNKRLTLKAGCPDLCFNRLEVRKTIYLFIF